MREFLKPNAERYAAFAKAHHHDHRGHVTISECPVCGFLEWQSTKVEAPAGHTVKRRDGWDAPCPCCESVRWRAPEVYDWVVNVAAMVLRQSRPADTTPACHHVECTIRLDPTSRAVRVCNACGVTLGGVDD